MSTEPEHITAMQEFFDQLEKMKPEFEKTLPNHVPVDRFIRTIRTAVNMRPDLMDAIMEAKASRLTFYAACMQAAQDGLQIDGRESTITVFNQKVKQPEGGERWIKKCQYSPMTAGILKKVRNSGELISLDANIVHDDDEFDYWIDEEGAHLKHRPKLDRSGDITYAYAIARTKDGGRYVEVMTKAEIEQVRQVSKAKDSGPWKSWFGEMAKKTVIRRLAKRLPMSTDLENLIRADDELFDFAQKKDETISNGKPSRLAAVRELGAKIVAHSEPMGNETEDRKVDEEMFTDEDMPI
jgi:recombination protein RecT